MAAILTYGNRILVATNLFSESTDSGLFNYGKIIDGTCMKSNKFLRDVEKPASAVHARKYEAIVLPWFPWEISLTQL